MAQALPTITHCCRCDVYTCDTDGFVCTKQPRSGVLFTSDNRKRSLNLPEGVFSLSFPNGYPEIKRIGDHLCAPLTENFPTELDAAVEAKLASKVHRLVTNGAKPTETTYDTAIRTQLVAVVSGVAKSGIVPTTQNLDLAVDQGDPMIVQWLIEAGAKPTEGTYAIAGRHDRPQTIPKLVRSGVIPTTANLHMVVQARMRDMVKMLVQAGAKPNKEIYNLAATYDDVFDHQIFYDLQKSDVPLTEGNRTTASKNRWIAIKNLPREERLEKVPLGAVPPEEDLKQAILNAGKLHIEVEDKKKLKQAVPNEIYELIGRTNDGIKRLIDAGVKPTEEIYYLAMDIPSFRAMNYLLASGVPPSTANLNYAVKNEKRCAVGFIDGGAIPTEETYTLALHSAQLEVLTASAQSGVVPNDDHLKLAVEKGFMFVECLVKMGAKPSESTYNLAIEADERSLKALLRSGEPLTANNLKHVIKKHSRNIEQIVRAGVEVTDEMYGIALQEDAIRELEVLLTSKVIPSTDNLRQAMKKRFLVVGYLIRAGAQPTEDMYNLAMDPQTPSYGICMLDTLLASKVLPTAKNLHFAIERRTITYILSLLGAGAKPTEDTYNLSITNKGLFLKDLLTSGIPLSKGNLELAKSVMGEDNWRYQELQAVYEKGLKQPPAIDPPLGADPKKGLPQNEDSKQP